MATNPTTDSDSRVQGARPVTYGRTGSPCTVGDFWLDKRSDAMSPNWQACCYDRAARTVRYYSCRTRDLEKAKEELRRIAASPRVKTAPDPEKRMPTTVYFIGAECGIGAVKIGVSFDPVHRMAALQVHSPIRLAVLATMEGGRQAERDYHVRFAGSKVSGEWFERTPSLEAEIARLGDAS